MEIKNLSREELNQRVIMAIDYLIRTSAVKNQKDFSQKMNETPMFVSHMKSNLRYASASQISALVNTFGLNAKFFLKKNNETEPIADPQMTNNVNVEGRENEVLTGRDVAKFEGGFNGNYYNVERMMNNAPLELKQHVRDVETKFELYMQENARLREEINDLKKIIGSITEQQKESQALLKEKDERLFQAQRELIEIIRKSGS